MEQSILNFIANKLLEREFVITNLAELLKKRAKAFLETARVNFSHGHYDLVLFHVEQFLQLYFKYLLCRKMGDFPKSHSLIRLLRDVMRVYGDGILRKFYEENLETIYLLEEAYITSRYLPREYGKDIAERILNFADEALKVLKCLEKESHQ